jgi:hypothetical protein
MQTSTKNQAQRENHTWHTEAKAWLKEAAAWQHDEATALQHAREEVARLEALQAGINGHVDALMAHLAVLEREPYGTTHEHERDIHHDQRTRHAEAKKAHHDAMRRGAR